MYLIIEIKISIHFFPVVSKNILSVIVCKHLQLKYIFIPGVNIYMGGGAIGIPLIEKTQTCLRD